MSRRSNAQAAGAGWLDFPDERIVRRAGQEFLAGGAEGERAVVVMPAVAAVVEAESSAGHFADDQAREFRLEVVAGRVLLFARNDAAAGVPVERPFEDQLP